MACRASPTMREVVDTPIALNTAKSFRRSIAERSTTEPMMRAAMILARTAVR